MLISNSLLNNIVLNNQQFDEFIHLCQTTVKPSDKLKRTAKTLDEEGFVFMPDDSAIDAIDHQAVLTSKS
ncbi:MAG: hypothetical protein ACI8WB_001660 [Phenylobacterium sp.]|jgi:hypothetical protein